MKDSSDGVALASTSGHFSMRARTTAELNRAVFALMCRHPGQFRTITADNGTEFHDYRSLEAATGVPFYFATPTTPGNAAPTKTPTGCYASTCPRARA